MGIHNREYMRDESSGSRFGRTRGGAAFENIVKTLIIINVVVFVSQLMIKQFPSVDDFRRKHIVPDNVTAAEFREYYEAEKLKNNPKDKQSVVEAWCMLDPGKVLQGQIWRLLTYAFLHSTESPYHILFNMMLLFMAGSKLQSQLGGREFLWFYLLACIASAVMYLLWGAITNSMHSALGASGGVSAVLMVYALYWPRERWLLMMIIPMPIMGIVLLYAAFDILPMLNQLGGNAPSDNVAHAAHIGGLLFGYLYFSNRWQVTSWLPNLPNRVILKRKPKLKVHRPEPEPQAHPPKPVPADVAVRVDQILAKISEQGESSLNDEERAFLAEASRQYRDR